MLADKTFKSSKRRSPAVHFTVWAVNGSPIPQPVLNKIEEAVMGVIEDERCLMQVVRV